VVTLKTGVISIFRVVDRFEAQSRLAGRRLGLLEVFLMFSPQTLDLGRNFQKLFYVVFLRRAFVEFLQPFWYWFFHFGVFPGSAPMAGNLRGEAETAFATKAA
jgi:hypothetical protein